MTAAKVGHPSLLATRHCFLLYQRMALKQKPDWNPPWSLIGVSKDLHERGTCLPRPANLAITSYCTLYLWYKCTYLYNVPGNGRSGKNSDLAIFTEEWNGHWPDLPWYKFMYMYEYKYKGHIWCMIVSYSSCITMYNNQQCMHMQFYRASGNKCKKRNAHSVENFLSNHNIGESNEHW